MELNKTQLRFIVTARVQFISAKTRHILRRQTHIDMKLHFVRLEVSRGAVKLLKINTEENPTDMLTKSVPSAKFNLCMNLAGICRN